MKIQPHHCTFILTTNGGIGEVELLFAGFGVAAAENARIRLVLVAFLDLLLFVVEPVALGTICGDRHLVELFRIGPELDAGITARRSRTWTGAGAIDLAEHSLQANEGVLVPSPALPPANGPFFVGEEDCF